MRLVLAAVSSNTQLSGVTRHAANLARCLLRYSDIGELHLIAAPWECQLLRETIAMEDFRLHLHSIRLKRSSPARNLWYYSDLPPIARQLSADVVHLSYPVPVDRREMPCPTVVTVHDLYPFDIPENFGCPRVMINRLILSQCLRGADALACVSDATHTRLQRRGPPEIAAKAVRIYNCVEPRESRLACGPLPSLRNSGFFMCVAQHRRNKNVALALRTVHRLLREGAVHPAMALVVVGIPGPETSAICRFIEREQMTRNVFLLSGISEEELQWCYRNCAVLLAPSITEGFGLPVAEGLMAGCRIVCSDIPPFRELGGDLCQYFELGENEEHHFADAIRSVLGRPKPGPAALPQLSARSIAGQLMSLYRKLTEGSSLPHSCPEPAEEGRRQVGIV